MGNGVGGKIGSEEIPEDLLALMKYAAVSTGHWARTERICIVVQVIPVRARNNPVYLVFQDPEVYLNILSAY